MSLSVAICDDYLASWWWLECSEKHKSFKLKIPQPDSERRHSPDLRTVFEIMIGPFSSCEIGKTWGTENDKKPYVK